MIEEINELKHITTDNAENDSRFDTGLTGGLGGVFPIKDKFLLTLEIRHNYGLYNVSKIHVVNDEKIMTNSTNMLIGFAYRIGPRAIDFQGNP